MINIILIFLLIHHLSVFSIHDIDNRDKPNILFIISEDLRPELKDYGRNHVITPNINKIASKSVIFDLANSQISVCAPSRASLLSGLRPETLGIYDFSHYGGIKFYRSIPSHFHRMGYQTSSSGKLFHWDGYRYYSNNFWGTPTWEKLAKKEFLFQNSSVTPDSINKDFRDAYIVNNGIKFLNEMNDNRKITNMPWFLGIGLKGTHMPYHIPEYYWNLYENHTFDIDPNALSFPSSTPLLHHIMKTEARNIEFMNDKGKKMSVKRESYQKIGNGRTISVEGWKELYRGYLACLSYADYQLGRLVKELDRLDLWKNTIVIFTSDHGMHVGEKGIWGKWSLFDESTRIPLLIHSPNHPTSYGKHYEQPVELIDIFPTLVDMSGVKLEDPCPLLEENIKENNNNNNFDRNKFNKKKKDKIKINIKGDNGRGSIPVPGEAPVTNLDKTMIRHQHCDPLDGESLLRVFSSYDSDSGGPSSFRKSIDFSLTQRLVCKFNGNDKDSFTWTDSCPFNQLPRNPAFGAMGYSIRTIDWRYTAWLEFDINTYLPSLDKLPLAEELYDHRLNYATSSNKVSSSNKKIMEYSSLTPAGNLGIMEMNNLADNNDHAKLLLTLRVKLYDYLWYNASFEHLFQKRVDQVKLHSIVYLRSHPNSHPHHKLYRRHYFSYDPDSMYNIHKDNIDKDSPNFISKLNKN